MTGRRNGLRLLVFLGWLFLVSVSVVYCSGQRPGMQPPSTNVIVMVPDGSSQSTQTLARWYNGKALSLDGLNSGTAKTYMANSVITDSAAAATAFATGHKTSARFLGIGPRTEDLLSGFRATAPPYEPVASVLDAAKLQGKAVGVVVTSRVSHATPAAFGSHVDDRDLESEIMEQMVYQDMDVVFGGGAGYLLPRGANYTTTSGATWQCMRPDRENLINVLKGRGYRWVDNKTDLSALKQGKVWGLFSSGHLEPQMDRDAKSAQPTLAEMTAKALGLDLAQATSRLFVDLATVYPGFSLDTSDSANPMVVLDREITLPVNKDILQIGDASYRLNGIVVYAPKAGTGSGKVFIPRQAVNLIKKHQGY